MNDCVWSIVNNFLLDSRYNGTHKTHISTVCTENSSPAIFNLRWVYTSDCDLFFRSTSKCSTTDINYNNVCPAKSLLYHPHIRKPSAACVAQIRKLIGNVSNKTSHRPSAVPKTPHIKIRSGTDEMDMGCFDYTLACREYSTWSTMWWETFLLGYEVC